MKHIYIMYVSFYKITDQSPNFILCGYNIYEHKHTHIYMEH